jgi:hypothetical protein
MTKKYLIADEVVFREIDGEILLVPICSSLEEVDSIYSVGGSGTWILRQLDHPCSEEELVDQLRMRYRVDAERAREDVHAFLADLEENGLVRSVAEEGS